MLEQDDEHVTLEQDVHPNSRKLSTAYRAETGGNIARKHIGSGIPLRRSDNLSRNGYGHPPFDDGPRWRVRRSGTVGKLSNISIK